MPSLISELFQWLEESELHPLIHERPEEYYESINLANNQRESTVFVKFMLQTIKQVLNELAVNMEEVEGTRYN